MELPFIYLHTVIMKHIGYAQWLAESGILPYTCLNKLAVLL